MKLLKKIKFRKIRSEQEFRKFHYNSALFYFYKVFHRRACHRNRLVFNNKSIWKFHFSLKYFKKKVFKKHSLFLKSKEKANLWYTVLHKLENNKIVRTFCYFDSKILYQWSFINLLQHIKPSLTWFSIIPKLCLYG